MEQHNRPPQEYIDTYKKLQTNIVDFLELKYINEKEGFKKEFVFIVPDISLTETVVVESLQVKDLFKGLNKLEGFRKWFQEKVNSTYYSQIKIDYIY